ERSPEILTEISAEEFQRLIDHNARERDSFLSSCMAEQGFDHIPVTWLTRTVTTREADSFISPGTREWAEVFGFGMTTANESGRSDWRLEVHLNIDREIERQYREAQAQMSELEFAAYNVALVDCELLFSKALLDHSPLDVFDSLAEEVFTNFPLAVEGDPRTLALNNEWSSCMLNEGWPGWQSPLHAERFFLDEIDRTEYYFSPQEYLDWDFDAYPEGPPTVSFGELRNYEIAVAVASWDCLELVRYAARKRDIEVDLQHQFVARHGTELEAWALYMEHLRTQ
ncbi:MAG: hypothetical protein FWG25_11195, partial [Promicromonosporaceae bacterium]|nr:hypothetical protein [Promicromonosporaceae bacterium]